MPMRLNIELKHNGREFYEPFTYLAAQNTKPLLDFPVRKFSVDATSPLHFLKISILKNKVKFRNLHSAIAFDVFVENIFTNCTSTKDYL